MPSQSSKPSHSTAQSVRVEQTTPLPDSRLFAEVKTEPCSSGLPHSSFSFGAQDSEDMSHKQDTPGCKNSRLRSFSAVTPVSNGPALDNSMASEVSGFKPLKVNPDYKNFETRFPSCKDWIDPARFPCKRREIPLLSHNDHKSDDLKKQEWREKLGCAVSRLTGGQYALLEGMFEEPMRPECPFRRIWLWGDCFMVRSGSSAEGFLFMFDEGRWELILIEPIPFSLSVESHIKADPLSAIQHVAKTDRAEGSSS